MITREHGTRLEQGGGKARQGGDLRRDLLQHLVRVRVNVRVNARVNVRVNVRVRVKVRVRRGKLQKSNLQYYY